MVSSCKDVSVWVDAQTVHEGGGGSLVTSGLRRQGVHPNCHTGSLSGTKDQTEGGWGVWASAPGACWGDGRHRLGNVVVDHRCEVRSATRVSKVSRPGQLKPRGASPHDGNVLHHCKSAIDRILSGTLECRAEAQHAERQCRQCIRDMRSEHRDRADALNGLAAATGRS